MRVFVTGATGYIGSAVSERLREAGHRVVGLARSVEAAEKVEAAGHEVYRGDVQDLDSLATAAREADGVVHAAFAHLWHDMDLLERVELDAVEVMLAALGDGGSASTPKPFLFTSGSGVLGPTGPQPAGEDHLAAPDPVLAWRLPIENKVLNAGRSGFGAPRVPVASAVFRVPLVHGYGRNAVVLDFLEQAKRDGEARYVGTGENHWSAVHVDDLADLYLLALEALASGALPPGTLIHPAATPTFSMRELAEAVAEGTGVGRTRSITIEEARGASPFPFADLYASEMRLDATFARETLGWRPSRLSLPEDIARGSYFHR